MNKWLLSFFLICMFIPPIVLTPAHGHGFGADTISSINVKEKEISITVKTPMSLDDSSKTQQVLIEAKDENTKENVKELTLLLGLYHDDEMVFRNYFYSPDGQIVLEINNDDSDVKITGKQDDFLGSYYATKEQPARISGSVFESGGLYDFEMEIRTIDDPKNVIDDSQVYRATVSIAETQQFPVSVDNGSVTFKVKSYFDTIENFNYDLKTQEISFEMPFDWSASNISHIPVVHVEVQFPKDYENLLHPNYSGKINGVDLFKSIVTVDDYTYEDDRIVHFVLLQDHLRYLKNQQGVSGINNIDDKMMFSLKPSNVVEFPVIAMTKNEEFRVDLSWDPVTIQPQNDTKFIFTIRDGNTGEPLRNSSYEFVIIQEGKELYRTSGDTKIGGGFVEYRFGEDQTGSTTVKFENIRGTGQETEFSILVTPEFGPLSIMILAILLTASLLLRKSNVSSMLANR